MLTVLAHATGVPLDGWTEWFGEPLLLLVVAVAGWLYLRGRRRSRVRPSRGRDAAFAAGLVALVAALGSPLDALATQLASAHMMQHVLLMLVAALVLAWSAPLRTLARGLPRGLHAVVARTRHRYGLTPRRVEPAARPLAVAGAHVVVLWAWHSPPLYDAAIADPALHAVEHASFFVSAAVWWSVVLSFPPRRGPGIGARILLVFGVAMQGVVLALLLTFAPVPWYESYVATTAAWGLGPLTDQHLAGAIMWVPAGAVYLGVALALLATWLRDVEDAQDGRRVGSGA